MTALSDALTAAQRSALAALEKAYVAGALESEAMVAALESVGISDPVDTAFLLAALDVLKEWGVSAPNLGVLDENGERFHCDCRADDWVEGDNATVRCEQCGGYAGEPGTSIRLVAAEERSAE